jgi:hypothetical protein
MGTNYYLHPQADCECCGRPFEPLHIGKSSGGWCFGLHVIPKEGINNYDDWKERWSRPGSLIRDEYGNAVTITEMKIIINERSGKNTDWDSKWWAGGGFMRYASESDFHRVNHSQRGPNFLLRYRVDGVHCLGHGLGTYDYIAGEFS